MENTHQKKKRIGVLALSMLMLVSTTMSIPRTAHAVDLVVDLTNLPFNVLGAVQQMANTVLSSEDFTKEFVLDPIAWIASKAVLQSMTQSMVNWVASGFDGSPAFVTDLQQNLLGVGDATANNFVQQLLTDGRIQSPFSIQVAQSVRQAYYQNTGTNTYGSAHPYTLNQTCANDASFFATGNFSDCGFSGWFSLISNPANNPQGSNILATDALVQRVTTAENTRKEELGWASGFQSWRGDCATTKATADDSANLSKTDNSAGCPIETPGSIVQSQLVEHLGAGVKTLISADELDEILSGLFTSLLDDVIGGSGLSGGGSGSSRPADTGASGSVAVNFGRTIDQQIERINQDYIAGWQRIKAIAQEAETECVNRDNDKSREVAQVLEQAATALAKGTNAIASLEALKARATASGGAANDFQNIATEYQTLLGSGALPSSSDIVYATQNSQDTPNANPETLYTRMKEIAQNCL